MSDSTETMGVAEPIGFTYLVTVAFLTEVNQLRMRTLIVRDWFEQFRVFRMHHPEAALVNVQQITLRQAQELKDD